MKLVVLTGSSRGLGAAIFEQLIGTNKVKLLCISKNINSQQSDMLKADSDAFKFIRSDFSSSEEPCFETNMECEIKKQVAGKEFSEIIFVSNSGVIEPIGMVGHLSASRINTATNINFIAPMLISQVLVRLAEQRFIKLNIINISSGAAKKPIPGWSVYCATKSAIMMFFDVMSKTPECNVINIDPGVLDTNMQKIIRNMSANEFPQINVFKELKEQGQLVEPAVAAKDIVKNHILS